MPDHVFKESLERKVLHIIIGQSAVFALQHSLLPTWESINGCSDVKDPLMVLISAHQSTSVDIFRAECSRGRNTPVNPFIRLVKVATCCPATMCMSSPWPYALARIHLPQAALSNGNLPIRPLPCV